MKRTNIEEEFDIVELDAGEKEGLENLQKEMVGNVYSREECVFVYCPNPDSCKQHDKCVNG